MLCVFINGFNLCVLYLVLIQYLMCLFYNRCDLSSPAWFICIFFEVTQFAPHIISCIYNCGAHPFWFIQFLAQNTIFENGEKTNIFLALIDKAQNCSSHILAMKMRVLVSDTNSILPIFPSFYKDLYASKLDRSKDDMFQYMQGVTLPRL